MIRKKSSPAPSGMMRNYKAENMDNGYMFLRSFNHANEIKI